MMDPISRAISGTYDPPMSTEKFEQPRNRHERRALLANTMPRSLRRKWVNKWTTSMKKSPWKVPQ